jgi:superfamily II DNA or RNA helicase
MKFAVKQRVYSREHPEFGFGVVHSVDEDLFDGVFLQVNFEHVVDLKRMREADLVRCDDFECPAEAAQRSDVRAVVRRAVCGAVVGENNMTGAFLRAAAQPLPHQAFLLDKVLSQDRFGHLLADDVGLGKTIEAGLIISTLRGSNTGFRVLIVCPAGLLEQWREEMDSLFGLWFSIVGPDFSGKSVREWEAHPLVIASIDALKRPGYESLLEVLPEFDLVVCDEAHRLTVRRAFFSKDGDLEKTANYRLFESLLASRRISRVNDKNGQPRSPRLLLLSATPHQGDDLRFLYLLNLVRPDLFELPGKGEAVTFNDQSLAETITRTAKMRALDWDGHPIFKPYQTLTHDVSWNSDEKDVSAALTEYIEQSLMLGQAASAIIVQLVMHTFHKIAASSWRALEDALQKRIHTITTGVAEYLVQGEEDDDALNERWLNAQKAFFEQELELLQKVYGKVKALAVDSKFEAFKEIILELEKKEPGCHVLVFTQYRSSQQFLAKALEECFPGCGVELIHGDVGGKERREARRRFEGASRFMVSTEAGGEGLNLQKASHIMVNYDLPWNPMRLQQRIGRLVRYGQQCEVMVFNMRVPDSWDARISTRILERLRVIQQTMEPITDGDENYEEMILGRVADSIDVESAFVDHIRHQDISDEELDEKLQEALASRDQWKRLFSTTLGYDASLHQLKTSKLTHKELHYAYKLALAAHGLELKQTRTSENQYIKGVYHFRLPDSFRDSIIRATKELYVAFDRERYGEIRDMIMGEARGQQIKTTLAGFTEPVTDWLFESVFNAHDGVSVAGIKSKGNGERTGWLLGYALRWQTGPHRMKTPDSMCFVFVGVDGKAEEIDSAAVCALLGEGAWENVHTVPPNIPMDAGKQCVIQSYRRFLEGRNETSRRIAAFFLTLALWVQEQ